MPRPRAGELPGAVGPGAAFALGTLLLAACASSRGPWLPEVPAGPDPIGDVDTSVSANRVVPLPASVDPRLHAWFDRYTRVRVPGAGFIHVLAQSGWRDEQIVRVRKVLQHMLALPQNGERGVDKRAIGEAMVARRATMVLFDDLESLERAFDEGLGELELGMQDLRANECPVEGDPDYLAHATRDAAFEEVLHLVHDHGLRPVHPEFDAALHAASLAAAEHGHWRGWPEDEPESWRNEYFAAAYDNYLDLWAVCPTLYEGEPIAAGDVPAGSSHFGAFGADSRAKLREVDPRAVELIEAFFPPHLTYRAELPPDFEGTFFLSLEPRLRYTHKSQHLDHVRLTGRRDANLLGNGRTNGLTGNAGDNRLEGVAGDDVLEGGPGRDLLLGGEGVDWAVFTGPREQYAVYPEGEGFVVEDSQRARDGTDRLIGIEFLQFERGVYSLPGLEEVDGLDGERSPLER